MNFAKTGIMTIAALIGIGYASQAPAEQHGKGRAYERMQPYDERKARQSLCGVMDVLLTAHNFPKSYNVAGASVNIDTNPSTSPIVPDDNYVAVLKDGKIGIYQPKIPNRMESNSEIYEKIRQLKDAGGVVNHDGLPAIPHNEEVGNLLDLNFKSLSSRIVGSGSGNLKFYMIMPDESGFWLALLPRFHEPRRMTLPGMKEPLTEQERKYFCM